MINSYFAICTQNVESKKIVLCIQSSDPDLRRSLDKQPTDSGGGIYQYDNYEEVAMDTDSETNSPGMSKNLKCIFTVTKQ